MGEEHIIGSGRSAGFQTTRWTMVHAAQDSGALSHAAALETLCQDYWYPLYAYVRRRGYAVPEAEDLTQDFFRRLIEKDYLKAADPDRGRFRTFLLVAMKRFLANEWRRAHAVKRGGGQTLFSIDAAEARYRLEPVDPVTPDSLYERRWALLMLERALAAVRQDLEQAERSALFDALKETLTGNPSDSTYAEIGATFGLSENGVKAAVHRLRKRFRQRLLETIGDTVRDEEDVEEEMRHLVAVLSEVG